MNSKVDLGVIIDKKVVVREKMCLCGILQLLYDFGEIVFPVNLQLSLSVPVMQCCLFLSHSELIFTLSVPEKFLLFTTPFGQGQVSSTIEYYSGKFTSSPLSRLH